MPEISIIVPIYNVEQYLKRCVDSILAQTFKDFELILVDDGSPDSCPFICDEYARIDSRIKVIHKANGGLSDARNAGLEMATGNYIAFVDSDDWIASDTYEYLYELIKKNEADVVSGSYVLTKNDDVKFSNLKSEIVIEGTSEILKFYFQQDKIHGKNDFPVWIKLYRRDLFNDIHFPDDKLYEDNITNFLIFSKCNKYVKSSKEIYAYFQRFQSITKTQLSAKHLSLIEVSKEMLSLSMKYGEELQRLAEKKLAMAYFSILTMYVRYGTDMEFSVISDCLKEYKKKKYLFLKDEKSVSVLIISFLICTNIKFCRKIFAMKNYKINRKKSQGGVLKYSILSKMEVSYGYAA